MIIYKLEDINNRIQEMKNNINNILDKGESHLSSDIDKYRSSKQEIMNSNSYSESGKMDLVNELTTKHYNGIKKDGESFISEIAEEYDLAIARVGTLMQYDSEAKAVQEDKVDKVKENTDLIYTVQVLNSIDMEEETGLLKELLEKYRSNGRIMNLIKLKSNKLNKKGVTSTALDEVRKNIKLLDTDYVEQLKEEKFKRIDGFRQNQYPNKAIRHSLDQIYEVRVGKSLLDFGK